ncbi:MSC_0775 family lipoprotein [Mycoplasma sp. Mirounga ES2805-ORL]|uniref:MSC_0775 family lipoprotein n=1 Tax=Mycoplasma sp. Mirounga ES2805-ORL TaxID=754514 RepID=UPI00197C8547|nr:hypothetical protein [Mycoplasma sp. Mirounga ES2805-ORL]QSF13553.1 hypothetical protein JXZ90_02670 [Mycoplasma sp. Mirounga ES2805-ORL]
MKYLNKKIVLGAIGFLCSTPMFISYSCNNNSKSKSNSNSPEDKHNELSKTAQLSKLSKMFEENDYSDQVLKFRDPKANATTVKFEEFSENNYLPNHFNFDFEQFKKVLKNDLKFEESFINNLNYEIDYHNIQINMNNKTEVLVPVKIKLNLNQNNLKGLYTERKIIFKLKGMKSNQFKSENDPLILFNNELKDNLHKEDIDVKISLGNPSIVLNIKKYGLANLSKSQINELFTLNIKKDLKSIISKYPDQEYLIKINGIQLDNENLDTAKIRIRVSNAMAKNGALKKGKYYDSIGFDLFKEVKLPYDKSPILFENKLQENVYVEPKGSNIYNSNFTELNKDSFNIYSLNKNISYKVINYKSIDFRNGALSLIAEYKNNGSLIQKEIIKKIGVGAFTNIYEEDFTKNNVKAYNFNADFLEQTDLSKINSSIYRNYGNQIFSGGYDSTRAFYTGGIKTPISLHVGEDYLAEEYTPVVSPFNGEVIAVYAPIEPNQTAQSVGTSLLIRIKKEELKLTPKEYEQYFNDDLEDDYFYVGYIHLDANKTMKNSTLGWIPTQATSGSKNYAFVQGLSPKNPTQVKKGQVVGYLGAPSTNGGWMPHVHTTVYTNRDKTFNENNFYMELDKYDKRINNYSIEEGKIRLTTARVDGVSISTKYYGAAKKHEIYEVDPIAGEPIEEMINGKQQKKIINKDLLWVSNPMSIWEMRKGTIDPNVIFKIRGVESFSFNIKDYFSI